MGWILTRHSCLAVDWLWEKPSLRSRGDVALIVYRGNKQLSTSHLKFNERSPEQRANSVAYSCWSPESGGDWDRLQLIYYILLFPKKMLADLPSEIVYHIATFLPTASSLTHLAQTCQRLHKIIAADDRIYRVFLRNRFPALRDAPPFWRDVTQAVTSRSRALDRCAVVARFIVPPQATRIVGSRDTTRYDRPTLGYRPSLDSHEVWTGERWQDREEVLAWGAAAEIILKIQRMGTQAHETWLRFNDLEHVSSHDDIQAVHLLRPDHPSRLAGKQHLIYGRARGDVSHIAIDPDNATYQVQQTFITNQTQIHSLDLSPGLEPILAVHNIGGDISLYRTTTEDKEVTSFARLTGETEEGTPRYYTKFLSPSRIAVGHGKPTDTIVISDVTEDHISTHRELTFEDPYRRPLWPRGKARVGAIAPLGVDTHGGRADGQVFLAGWGNSRVRYVFYLPFFS